MELYPLLKNSDDSYSKIETPFTVQGMHQPRFAAAALSTLEASPPDTSSFSILIGRQTHKPGSALREDIEDIRKNSDVPSGFDYA